MVVAAPGNRCAHTTTADGPRAAFPRDAEGKPLTGVVRLRVSVDAEGKVVDVLVTKSAGSALDAAARDAIRKMKFSGSGEPKTFVYSYEFAKD